MKKTLVTALMVCFSFVSGAQLAATIGGHYFGDRVSSGLSSKNTRPYNNFRFQGGLKREFEKAITLKFGVGFYRMKGIKYSSYSSYYYPSRPTSETTSVIAYIDLDYANVYYGMGNTIKFPRTEFFSIYFGGIFQLDYKLNERVYDQVVHKTFKSNSTGDFSETYSYEVTYSHDARRFVAFGGIEMAPNVNFGTWQLSFPMRVGLRTVYKDKTQNYSYNSHITEESGAEFLFGAGMTISRIIFNKSK